MSNVSGPGNSHGPSFAPGQIKKAEKAEGKSGEKAAPAEAPKADQKVPVDAAIQQLDAAIKTLTAQLQQDSFNGQSAPAGVGGSKLENPVTTMASDTFAPQVQQSAPAPAAPTAAFVPAQDVSGLGDPRLAEKGGGGAGGGVTSDLMNNALGGGGAGGGVTSDRL